MKKAQIKMGETIAVLVVFFILIMVGLVIYTNLRENSIEQKRIEEQELKGVEIATRISQLPDIRCDRSMCIGCTDAIDILKLETFLDEYQEGGDTFLPLKDKYTKEYYDMFEQSSIIIDLIYPDPDDGNFDADYPEWTDGIWDFHTSWNIYDQTPEEWGSAKPIFIPINLYNAFSEECYFGILSVTVYEP